MVLCELVTLICSLCLPECYFLLSPCSPRMQHEQKKKQREEEERREKVRKASALLHGMKKATEKKEREYRGIVNSRAAGMYNAAIKF